MFFILILLIIIFFAVEFLCRLQKRSLLEILHPDWYRDVRYFPQHAFPCQADCQEYAKRTKDGYSKMKNLTVVFTGLCINIEEKVDSLKTRIEYLGSFFKDYRVVIFENDSKDRTRTLLKEWSTNNKRVHIVPCPEDDECKLKYLPAVRYGTMSDTRMKRMADYRNRTITYILKHFNDFDCVAVMDLDIKGPISVDGIANSFGYYGEWDSISAYGINGITLSMGRGIYYDLIAYKDKDYDINQNRFHVIPIMIKTAILNKRGYTPFKVKSGFAGMALYKMDVFKNGITYSPLDGEGYTCEHVMIHNNMIQKGYDKIYINPNMVMLVGPQGDVSKYPFY